MHIVFTILYRKKMDMNTILLSLVIFFANVIQAITGFAGTVLAMPAAILLIGMTQAKVVLSCMALLSCAMITVQTWRHILWREVGKISGCMLLGMVPGLLLCDWVPSDVLLPAYGVLVMAIGGRNLLVKTQPQLSRSALIGVLLAAGVIHGLFLSGGALLVIYATFVLKDKQVFRATIAPIWVILNTILLVIYFFDGALTTQNMTLVGINCIPLVIATIWGNRLQAKMNQQTFLKLTYVLLIISGLSLL